jgi:hypothetical protein
MINEKGEEHQPGKPQIVVEQASNLNILLFEKT